MKFNELGGDVNETLDESKESAVEMISQAIKNRSSKKDEKRERRPPDCYE